MSCFLQELVMNCSLVDMEGCECPKDSRRVLQTLLA